MRIQFWFAVSALALSGASGAASDVDAVRTAVEKLNPGVKVDSPRKTPVAGLYETVVDGVNGYVTSDGRYFIVGDMYDINERRNLAEDTRKEHRLRALKEIDERSAIVFSQKVTTHTITVFTDVDCGYCRKLHSEVAKYNEQGIAVRYVAFPRSGPDSESWKKMEAVWCSKDRRDALTKAKLGEKIQAGHDCKTDSVARHYSIGETLGLQGTPMIVLEDGSVIGGYIPPQALAAKLKESTGQHAAAQ